jgi:signal transduction histidine kinase/ActR/RegA family two-component response regulator
MGDAAKERPAHDELVAALRERELQLEEAMRIGRIVPFEWNIESDVVTRAFDSKLFGTAPPNLAEFLALMLPEDRPAVRAALAATLERGVPYVVTYRRQIPDDQMRWFEARASLVRRTDGAPAKLVGVVMDVTDRKELELRLAQSQKMEAIGLLAGGIAHDFNNILTTIMGGLDLLQMRERLDRNLIQEIVRASNRAASLIRQLLEFSRRDLIAPTAVAVSRVVEEVLSLTRRTLREDIAVEVDLGPTDWHVLGDSGQLTQVLLNLVINARDAMPYGGQIRITAHGTSFDESRARSLAVPPGDYVVLCVTDTGVGMDTAAQARVFEPFFTTKSLGRGTGLGLSTVYGAVKQSGGAITVESAPGQGSRFDVYLPRTAAAPPRPAGVAVAPARHAAATILLVEDDDSVRKIARTVLVQAGYQVTDAGNGALALAATQLREDCPDLLLTDVVMPGLGGVGLAEKLRAQYPDLKVLFMSGYADEAMFRDGARALNLALLRKPFSAEALLAAVAGALDKRSA